MAIPRTFKMIENYIYLYHVDQFIVLPTFPDSIQDRISINFNKSTPMSRSAPIYSYSDSGPRSLQVQLDLHRDMMTQINYGVSNVSVAIGDDYIDTLIKQIQAAALPSYAAASKMVDPPIVAVRFGDDIFIKGVVVDGVSVADLFLMYFEFLLKYLAYLPQFPLEVPQSNPNVGEYF